MNKVVREYGCLIVLLVLITLYSGYYVSQKAGFYVDEGMTLYLSNGIYTGAVTTVPEATIFSFVNDYVIKDSLPATLSNIRSMLEDVVGAGDYSVKGTVEWYDAARSLLQGKNTWMKGSELYDMCTASKGSRFDYGQVYINQAMDVHPFIYYFVVHTVFSLFPGVYSNYFLFGINLVCLLVTCVLIYKMSIRMGTDPYVSLLGVAIYGFSQGFVSCAVFFRMYAMQTMLVFITFCYYMFLKEKDYELVRKDYIILGLIEIIGFNIHYYYIIYLAALFLTVLADMIGRKKNVKKMIASQVVTGIVSLMIWPFSLYHIFFGYRGTEAFSRLTSFGLIRSISDYIGLCAGSLVFGWAGACIVVCAAIITCVYKRHIKHRGVEAGYEEDRQDFPIKETVIPVAVYLVLVGKVAPSASARYVMCLFPILVLCMVRLVSSVFCLMALTKRTVTVAGLTMGVLYVVCTFAFEQPDYLYPEMGRTMGIDIDKGNTNCLVVASEHYKGFPYLLRLCDFDRVMVVDAYMLDTINEIRPEDEKEDMVVYIDNTLDREEVIGELNGYGYLEGRKITETESDLIDFSLFCIKAE